MLRKVEMLKGEVKVVPSKTIPLQSNKTNNKIYKLKNITTMDTATNNEWRTDYKLENRRVKNVRMTTEKGKNPRISFELDGEPFKSYDYKTGEKITTNTFSLDIANIGLQCGELKEFKRAQRYLLGANLTPIIISCVLDNAVITLDRVFKAKGEKRENSEDTYTNDLFKSVIKDVKVDMDEFAKEDYNDAISSLKEAANKSVTTKTTETTTTTFGLIW